jgi:hypothetical protein
MKKIFILLLILLIIPSIFAIDITVEQKSSDEVMIMGLENPTIFDLEVTNHGSTDDFVFYTFFGAGSYPQKAISIEQGKTKTVEFGVYPRSDFAQRGLINFNLFIQGQNKSEQTIPLSLKVTDLESSIKVSSEKIDPGSNSLQIDIENTVNFDFGDIKSRFKSPFFDFREEFSLGKYEKKSFNVELDKEDFSKIMAGFYTINAQVNIDGQEANIEGTMKFSEKNILKTTEEKYGFFIQTNIIKKSNQGNVMSESETVIKKNIITRLFTSLNPEPDISEREGATIYYTWTKQIKPGEIFQIKITTNWLLPLLIIFLIVAVVVLTKKFSKTDLVLRKRIGFVRVKGGEFALKISIFLNAKKYIERINIIDKLPPLVKVHERFGAEKPTRINEKTKRIEWNFEKLEAGEMRTLTYIVYSKIGVLGKFALPTATAIYEKEGEIHEVESNKAFFIAEQLGKKVRE